MSKIVAPTYVKNLGYHWLMFLRYCVFCSIVSVFGGLALGLLPIATLLYTMSIRGPREDTDKDTKTVIAVVSLMGALVFNGTAISLLLGFTQGEWIWAQVFLGGYFGLCALIGFLISLVLISFERSEREEYDTDESSHYPA